MSSARLARGFAAARAPSIARRPIPAKPNRRRTLFLAGIAAAAALIAVAAIFLARGPTLSGTYESADGAGSMEFRSSRVYITTVLGTTFVSTYEVDGNRVVIKGAGGAQVFTRSGTTLDGGVGMKFTKRSDQANANPHPE